MKAWLGLTVGLLVAVALLWVAGEMHRENCIRDERSACSVLPWQSGKEPPRGVVVRPLTVPPPPNR